MVLVFSFSVARCDLQDAHLFLLPQKVHYHRGNLPLLTFSSAEIVNVSAN